MRDTALLPKVLAVHLKTMLVYRANFVMGALAQIVYTLLTAVFVDAFLLPGQTLQGWSFWQVIFLFGFGDLAFGLSAVFLFRIFLSFESDYIIEGRLDQLLVHPLPILYALILRNIDLNHLAVVLKGAVLVVVSASMLEMSWSIGRVAALVLLAVCGAAIYAGLYLAFVSLGFWFRRRASLAGQIAIKPPAAAIPAPIQGQTKGKTLIGNSAGGGSARLRR